jgi:hypothetical protein
MDYFRFRVRLQGIRPPVWRCLLLPATASFAELHEAIQDCGGWLDCHLYTFLESGARRAQIPTVGTKGIEGAWSSTPLVSWFGKRGEVEQKCVYWYDFGDDWLHEVELEGLEEHPESHGRRLLGGARSFPPEDCGGIPGYERSVRLWEDARSSAVGAAEQAEEDVEFIEWLGDWNPERFDLDAERRRFDPSPRSLPPSAASPSARWRSVHLDDLVNDRGDDSGLSRPVPAPARNLTRHLRRIVRAASLHPPGEPVTTGLPCFRRPDRRPCRGCIIVVRQDRRGDIEYRCAVCSDGGVVSGWRGGRDDLSEFAAGRAATDGDDLRIRIPAEIYRALLDERTLAIDSARLLYSARASAGQVVLRGSIDEIEDLCEETCADANHAPRGALRKRLMVAGRILGSVIEGKTDA